MFRRVGVLAGVTLFCANVLVAQAATISPVLIDQHVDPGSQTQGTIHLLNDGPVDTTYYTSVQNFVPQGEEGQQSFLPDTDTSGLVSWIHLSQSSVTVKHGQGVDFSWALTVPKDAEPGGHYAAVFFSTVPPAQQGSASVGVGAKIGALFLVNVSGNIHEGADVESFGVDSGTFTDHLPVTFGLRIRDTGDVHFSPGGSITVTDLFGSKVADIPVNPGNRRVLPKSIRHFEEQWGETHQGGSGFLAGLAAEWNGFAFGRYTASLHATYGSGNQPLTGEVTFWVIPWKLVVSILIALIILAFALKGYNKMVIRAATSKSKKQ